MKRKFDLERSFTMKTNRIRTLVMATLGLFAAAALAGPAAAQSACKGNFKLSNDIRWNGNVLPAGEYSFVLESATVPALIVLRGPKGSQILMSVGQTRSKDGKQSFMAIERRHGSGYVRELYLAPIGVHFFYNVPKAPKEELLAQETPTTERVLISTTGK
jgi:hypothetical protein